MTKIDQDSTTPESSDSTTSQDSGSLFNTPPTDLIMKIDIPPKTKNGKMKQKIFIRLGLCKNKCKETISYKQQRKYFKKYWKLPSNEERIAYMTSLIEIKDKKRVIVNKSTRAPRNRTHTYVYSLQVKGEKIVVCHKCFKQTFDVTDSFLKKVIKTKKLPMVTKKLSNYKFKEIRAHIKRFPSYSCHGTSTKYLQSNLNISVMYELYRSSHSNPASITNYLETIKGMDLKFKRPKLGPKCTKCIKLEMQILNAKSEDEIKKWTELKTMHSESAMNVEKVKADDIESAKSNKNIKVYTFSTPQCLPTPRLRSNTNFYIQPFWTYNLTIHNCVTEKPFCYMWAENIASRDGNSIASCLFQHLVKEQPNVEHIILYSDWCAGDTTNLCVAMMFTTLLKHSKNIKTIDYKLFMMCKKPIECDGDYLKIEKSIKKSNIEMHHPREWYQFVRTIWSKRNFDVIEMEQVHMFDFDKTTKTECKWRKKNCDGEPIKWVDIKLLRFTKEIGQIQYKTSHNNDEPFKVWNIGRRGKKTMDIILSHCYDGPAPINSTKKDGLVSQLNLINEIYHNFYLNLTVGDVPNIDPDLLVEHDSETEDMDKTNL